MFITTSGLPLSTGSIVGDGSRLRFIIAVSCSFEMLRVVLGLLFFKTFTTDARIVSLELSGTLRIPVLMFAMILEVGMDLGVVAKFSPFSRKGGGGVPYKKGRDARRKF